MATVYYPAIVERGAEGFGVFFPDLPGCISAGATVQEAALNAEEALAGHLAVSAQHGDAIAAPSDLDAIERDEEVDEVARMLPVLPLLEEWLQAEWTLYAALKPEERVGRGWLVNYYGRPVKSIDSAWAAMLVDLKMPTVREWRPYVLRHSLATLVRNRGAERWDLEGYMGHRAPSQTEVCAVGEFSSVVTALNSLIHEIEQLAPGSLRRNDTGSSRSAPTAVEAVMPG